MFGDNILNDLVLYIHCIIYYIPPRKNEISSENQINIIFPKLFLRKIVREINNKYNIVKTE
jgi:hypothetical protein